MSTPSYLRRTEDLKRLKTRALYVQGADGSVPGPNTVPHFNPAGALDFTNVKIVDGGNSVDIPGDLTVGGDTLLGGNLTVDGVISGFIDTSAGMFETLSVEAATIQDLSANSIWTNTEVIATHLTIEGTAAVLNSLSVGKSSGTHTLDVSGNVYVNSGTSSGGVFTTPGVYTIAIPASISSITFEMIGAGGSPGFPGSIGGGGGYMRGSITGVAGQTLTLQVGGLGLGGTNPSTASYITIPGSGPLYAITGAGGNGGGSSGAINGGAAGGGGFYVFGAGMVANGLDGVDTIAIPGTSHGRGGTSVGGAGGTGGFAPGTAGANPSGSFVDAVGGASAGGGSGGGGFSGGGGGASSGAPTGGGGGGSSFYNLTYTALTAHYAGDTLPAGVLPGYGRSNQTGYIAISYAGQPSLQTTGDIVCGGDLDLCGSFAIRGDFDILGNLTIGGGLQYRQPSDILHPIPQRVCIYSEVARVVSSTATDIQLSILGPPFDSLKKIEIEMNGSISTAATIYIFVNNLPPLVPVAQCVSGAVFDTIFTAKHTFEMSKRLTTFLMNYGSYEAVDTNSALVGSGQYHPTNINLSSTTINEFWLKTSNVGDTASIDINIYAYV